MNLIKVGLDTWQVTRGRFRYQIRQSRGELGPWFLDIYNDLKLGAPGQVDVVRISNLRSRDACEEEIVKHRRSLVVHEKGHKERGMTLEDVRRFVRKTEHLSGDTWVDCDIPGTFCDVPSALMGLACGEDGA